MGATIEVPIDDPGFRLFREGERAPVEALVQAVDVARTTPE